MSARCFLKTWRFNFRSIVQVLRFSHFLRDALPIFAPFAVLRSARTTNLEMNEERTPSRYQETSAVAVLFAKPTRDRDAPIVRTLPSVDSHFGSPDSCGDGAKILRGLAINASAALTINGISGPIAQSL